jgi:hypothetical protein
MKRQDEEKGKERGGRRKERCKEEEDNDKEQGGVNIKKINQVFIFIHLYTFTDQKTITPSRFLSKGWGLKAGKLSNVGSSSPRSNSVSKTAVHVYRQL